jgi:uncharacterized protein (TIRG00374 family)
MDSSPGAGPPGASGSRWRWIAGTLLLAALFVVALRHVEWRRFADIARNAEPAWLLGAVLVQLTTYVFAAGVLHRGIAASGVNRPLRGLIPLGVAKLFVDQVVPTAGLGGTLLVVRARERRGVSRGVATAAVVVNLLAFYAAYALAVGATLLALWFLHSLHPAVLVLVTVFAGYAIAVPVLILWIVYGGPRARPQWLSRVPGLATALRAIEEAPSSTLRHPVLFLESTVLQLLIVLADAVTLEMLLRALGQSAGFGVVFASFVLASVAATVSLLPGGIGSFEAGSVASLHYLGLPIEISLAATLLLRVFTAWLPLVPGLWFARHEMPGFGRRR